MTHPKQPTYIDKHGVKRFKPNAIIEFLQARGNIDMNEIALLSARGMFTREDRRQLAQLIGYSVNGYEGLSYVMDED
jgi:hypothetical protein